MVTNAQKNPGRVLKMNKTETCARIQEVGIIPAVRVSSTEEAHFATEAVCSGGIPIVEITLTVARAVELIAHLSHYHPKTSAPLKPNPQSIVNATANQRRGANRQAKGNHAFALYSLQVYDLTGSLLLN